MSVGKSANWRMRVRILPGVGFIQLSSEGEESLVRFMWRFTFAHEEKALKLKSELFLETNLEWNSQIKNKAILQDHKSSIRKEDEIIFWGKLLKI